MEGYAVITGASMGLGRSFAREAARRGINTILVSLPGENLHLLAEELREMGTDSHAYETDMTVRDNIVKMCRWINERFEVFMLINNAGLGGTRSFVSCEVGYIDAIIQVNVMASTIITHQLLPNLLRQPRGYILNVSSMAAFSPIGYKTVYPASKRFLHYFSRGLYQELKGTSVFVSVVHPGPMKTNRDVTRRIERQGFFGRMGLLSPDAIAKISIGQLLKRDTMILPGTANQFNWVLMHIVPVWAKLRLMSNVVARELEFEMQPVKDDYDEKK